MILRILALLAPVLLLGTLWWVASHRQIQVNPENTPKYVIAVLQSKHQEESVFVDTTKLPTYRVLRVVDGDTLDVQTVGKVRLIGINAPESVKPDTMPECYGKEASEILKSLLSGESVRLVYDVERYDQYGRALAYVYRSRDGLFVNAELVRVGAAEAREYRPNTQQHELLEDFETHARGDRLGLWALCR